ncbi:MAG: DUF4625 domain-containing protein [Chitinophagaceae bacterium]|nr:DUF4625 domain-containing protein [Chitinophagaceae bacterium]
MKSKIFWWHIAALLCVNVFLLSSCSKENAKPAAPTIEIVHLGIDDGITDNIFYIGEEGHFEVNITAPARIEKIDLEIRQESGYGNFTITKTYTGEYVGKKELRGFQDYPVVPEGQGIGAYSFHLKVTDQQGQVTSVDRSITVEIGDGTHPGHQHDDH